MIKPNEEVMYLQIKESLQGNEAVEYDKRYLKFFNITNVHSRVDKEKEDEWQKYLDELDQLSDKNSLLALKIITALIYRRNVLYHNERMFELLVQKQDSYFLNASTARYDRLMYGIELVKAWPDDVGSQFTKYFTPSLELLFVEEATENPKHALELFDNAINSEERELRENRMYFFSFLHNSPVNVLSFARKVEKYRPLFFVNALVNFVKYYNNEWHMLRGKALDSNKLRAVSTELYEIIDKQTYPEGFKLENTLQTMIRYCPIKTPWYENLFDKLWEIESAKNETDKESVGNYFLISLNSKNKKLMEDVEKYYCTWRDRYKLFDLKDMDIFTEHISALNKIVKNIFNNNFADYRNIHLGADIQKSIIDDFLMLYWDILEWTKDKNRKLYFMILVRYLQIDYYTDEPMTQRMGIAKKAKEILQNEFESFANEDIESAAYIVGMLLKNSNRYKKTYTNQLLNKVFFILKDIDEVSADIELAKVLKKEEEHYKHYDRGGPDPWRPSYAAVTEYATPNLLKRLTRSNDDKTRINVAKNPNAPVEVLEALSRDTNEEVRSKVALNPSTSLETLKKLVDSGEDRMVSLVCKNPNMDADFLYEMCQHGNYAVRSNIAENPNISQECIELLSRDKERVIRSHIAENSKISSAILAHLAKDIEYVVKQAVAKNPNTPSKVLDELSKSSVNAFSLDVLQARANNMKKKFKSLYRTLKYKITGNYADYLFEGLFTYTTDVIHEYSTIRSNVASNPNTPLTTLERLLDDENNHVVLMAEGALKKKKKG